MPKFFASEETERVDLGDGFWVEVKTELDYGEESELEGAAIKAGLNADGSPKLEFSLKQQRALLLTLYVTDWNLAGPNGKTIQLPSSLARRQELLSRLDAPTARRIAAAIDRIRKFGSAADALSLAGVEGAEENPTLPGDDSETETPSSSAAGGAVSAMPRSSKRPTALSARR